MATTATTHNGFSCCRTNIDRDKPNTNEAHYEISAKDSEEALKRFVSLTIRTINLSPAFKAHQEIIGLKWLGQIIMAALIVS